MRKRQLNAVIASLFPCMLFKNSLKKERVDAKAVIPKNRIAHP